MHSSHLVFKKGIEFQPLVTISMQLIELTFFVISKHMLIVNTKVFQLLFICNKVYKLPQLRTLLSIHFNSFSTSSVIVLTMA